MPFKYTNQIRNTTNRQIFQHEFFDKHATEVVANDFATAVQEAISADSKSSFPYIADTLVTGMSQLRPGIPLHLDGVGDEYSGYWTVLNVEHEITESSINRYMFNSRVTVGTDSLGAPINTGVPLKPGDIPTRNLNPSIRNTVLKPKNLINNPVVAVKPITTVSLVSRMNRNNITGVTGSMATWTSDLGDLTAPAATATGYSPVIAKAAKYYATH